MSNRIAANIARASPLTSTSISFVCGSGDCGNGLTIPFGAAANRAARSFRQTSSEMEDHTGHDPDNHDRACCAPGRPPGGEESAAAAAGEAHEAAPAGEAAAPPPA